MSANAGVHHVTGRLKPHQTGGDLGTVVDVRTGADMPGRPPGRRLRPPRRVPRGRRRGAGRNGRRAQGARAAPDREINRCCFRSVYSREPGGVLFEIATDGPGFTVNEPKEMLGNAIKLPLWYGSRRAEIVAALPPPR